MPDLLLAVLIFLAVLAVAGLVLRWVAKVEQRADERQLMGRVYYPTRGRKAGVPTLRRRRASGRRKVWYERNGNGELVDFDERQDPDP